MLLFLGGLILLVYFNALGNGFVSDDWGFINDPAISHIKSLIPNPPYINFNLRVILIFFINQLFGLNPFFFRLPNVLAHLGSAILIFALVRKLSGATVATISAVLFAVHPILTEGVTWISGGGYSLYTFFLLASLFSYIHGSIKKHYYLSILLFYLALLSSEKAIVFPLILVVYELALGNLKGNLRKIIPFFILAGLWIVILISQIDTRISSLQISSGAAPGRLNPLIQIPIAVTSYLQLIFWPDGLTLYHSEMFFSRPEYLIRLGIFVLFLAGIVFSYFKNRKIFFWLSFFLISLIPTLTPLGISWIVAERYVYLGTVGIIVTISMLSEKNKTLWYGLVIAAFLLALRTISRNFDWQSHDTLWLATARVSPSSSQNHNNLGDYYGRRGDLQRAAEEFEIAIKLNPQYADAYHNLGNAYRDMGRLDPAIENYQTAIKFNPNIWQSYFNIAAIYYTQKKFPEAKEYLNRAAELNPEVLPLTKKF